MVRVTSFDLAVVHRPEYYQQHPNARFDLFHVDGGHQRGSYIFPCPRACSDDGGLLCPDLIFDISGLVHLSDSFRYRQALTDLESCYSLSCCPRFARGC